jgi:hypothetical protein
MRKQLAQLAKRRVRTLLYPLQRRLRLGKVAVPRRRSAIMLFDPSVRYGGWIDRVKGIVSTYDLARSTSREFRLHAGPTFPIDGLLEPATFDWRIGCDEIRWNPLNSAFHVSRDRTSAHFQALANTRAANVFVDTNLDYLPQLHPTLAEPEVRALWAERFHEIFKPTQQLAIQVDAHRRPSATALHARFTGLLGDFRDVSDNALPPPKREELLAACIERTRAAASTVEGPLLVFSDSQTFLDRVRDALPTAIILPGIPTHIDRAEDPKQTMRKTLLDFFVMASCPRIMLLRLGPMYRSAFSRYASYVHGGTWSELT